MCCLSRHLWVMFLVVYTVFIQSFTESLCSAAPQCVLLDAKPLVRHKWTEERPCFLCQSACVFKAGILCVGLAVLTLICRPGWPCTEKSACFCFQRAGVKAVFCHTKKLKSIFFKLEILGSLICAAIDYQQNWYQFSGFFFLLVS